MRHCWVEVIAWVMLLPLHLTSTASAAAADLDLVKTQFAHPPRQYSSGPLWVWNDMLTEEQIDSTLGDLAGQKVKQAFVHPRPGLMTPYLSDDWFRLWNHALKAAERLDMNIWIYDENSYPSGFAGGLVPAAMPESRGQGLAFRNAEAVPKRQEDVLAVFRMSDAGYENVTRRFQADETMPKGSYLIASITDASTGGWFGGKFYVDLLYPGVTERFLEITMEAYRREIGHEFGNRVPGVFTDEPHLAPAGGLHWSDHLPALFQDRWGYDLLDHLPGLVRPVGDWKRVRHNYYQLLLEQFIECWARPFFEYCKKHDLEFTGHYWEHGWPDAGHGGDNMAMYAWHQRPAIDTLMNQYREDVHAQFGNVRAVLELASVANQLGRTRTLCEAYGAGGWDLRFEDMKRIGDWLYVLGVNTLNEHLSYITIRGARKRDHPQSFSYHEPWWEAYHIMAEYFTRLSLVLSAGEQVHRVLVIEPTTAAWMYQSDPRVNQIGDQFQAMVTTLAKAQVEFDIGCEDIMGRHGAVDGAELIIGRRRYDTVVLAPLTENLNTKTMDLLEDYLAHGGIVLSCDSPPARVDGQVSDRGPRLAQPASWRPIDASAVGTSLLSRATDGFSVRQLPDDVGILFHHRRRLKEGEFLFLVNTNIEAPCAGKIRSHAKGIQRWDPQTGDIGPYFFSKTGEGVTADFMLPPCGSLLLWLSNESLDSAAPGSGVEAEIAAAGSMEVRRVEPNVLTLDFVDITAGGQNKKNLYFYAAARFAFEANGLPGNPWDSAVQFRDELIQKTFARDSGFEATYRFTVERQVPDSLYVVIERSDLYTVTCNEKPVVADPDDWWLDRSFSKVDITSATKVGQNAVKIKAGPMTVYHELEPAYLLGNFSLRPTEAGFIVVPDQSLSVGPWNEQGQPFYGAGVAYAQDFEIETEPGRYVVSLSEWKGSVARVIANGKPAGYIAYPPWTCDVTDSIVPGRNRIEVLVIGTLKNTLGPHHAGELVGAAWPHMFQQAPETGPPSGRNYHTLGYGLFERFGLKRVR